MTDRAPQASEPARPSLSHPLRDWLSLELMLPAQPAMLDDVLDRLEPRRPQ